MNLKSTMSVSRWIRQSVELFPRVGSAGDATEHDWLTVYTVWGCWGGGQIGFDTRNHLFGRSCTVVAHSVLSWWWWRLITDASPNLPSGFPLDLEKLEKWEYTWKTWKYHGILKNLINIMEKWHETWKSLVATINLPSTPLKQYKIN